LAIANGLRACWSTPLLSRKGTVLGSFALYSPMPRGPNRRERELLDFATQLATIALERHVEEQETEEQRREVAHLGRVALVGGLSGALAHELSQPLAAILSDAQAGQRLLSRDPPDLDEIREILDDIVFAQERAGAVIDRLRGFLTKRHDEFARLDMNSVLTEALHLLRNALRDRHVLLIVELELDPDLPPIMGDRVQLIQVLLNLIMNASEAMAGTPVSERHIRVSSWSSPEGAVYVSVSDRGAGIPGELVGRVGEPFVTTKNNPDRGATFLLTLPPMNHALFS
jgi:C4-dicarboxylate-specific signal transduction histidine kinase